jgi:hypothetical protein
VRTTVFARVASMATACELFSPLLSSVLMLKGSWIPVLLGFATLVVGASATLAFLPETLARRPRSGHALDACAMSNTPAPLKLRMLGDQITTMLTVFQQSFVSVFAIKNVSLLLFGFFAATVGTIAAAFELQYVHKRFGWSYSYVSFKNYKPPPQNGLRWFEF